LADLGRSDDAVKAARAAQGPEVLADLAVHFARHGDLTLAASAAAAAARRRPTDPELQARSGLFYHQTGQLRGAIEALTIAHDAGVPWASSKIADSHQQLGEPVEAARWFARAAADGDDPRAWIGLADAAWQAGSLPSEILDEQLVEAFGQPIDHQRLQAATRGRLWGRCDDELVRNRLFHALLRQTLVMAPAWEARLIALRASVVHRTDELAQRALRSLAHQAWSAEFTWPDTLEGAPEVGDVPTMESVIAVTRVAAYRPLCSLADCSKLTSDPWLETPLAELIDLQLLEPERARRAAVGLPRWSAAVHPVSQAVQAQYEEHPYPRLVNIHRGTPTALGPWLRRRFPHGGEPPCGPACVLVVGAGTGQHPLTTATTFSDVHVTGIDLSSASLGRAVRYAQRWGIDNVRFAVADLLGLDLPERFDVVESVGVLHHLDDPSVVLSLLVGHLRQGGWMRLGVYSETARTDVVAARALLSAHNIEPTDRGIREARALLMGLPPEHPAHSVVWSPDFYSLSGCRDLVLPAKEHRFTLPSLADWLDTAGLRFIGFENPVPGALHTYRQRFPDDPSCSRLDLWHQLEEERPRLFAGMYVFWCKRVSD